MVLQPEFEYKIVNFLGIEPPAHIQGQVDYDKWLLEQLERHSQGGWELAATDGTRYFFKRPKDASAQ